MMELKNLTNDRHFGCIEEFVQCEKLGFAHLIQGTENTFGHLFGLFESTSIVPFNVLAILEDDVDIFGASDHVEYAFN